MADLAAEYLEMYAKTHKNERSYIEGKRRIDNVILKRCRDKKVEEKPLQGIKISEKIFQNKHN